MDEAHRSDERHCSCSRCPACPAKGAGKRLATIPSFVRSTQHYGPERSAAILNAATAATNNTITCVWFQRLTKEAAALLLSSAEECLVGFAFLGILVLTLASTTTATTEI